MSMSVWWPVLVFLPVLQSSLARRSLPSPPVIMFGGFRPITREPQVLGRRGRNMEEDWGVGRRRGGQTGRPAFPTSEGFLLLIYTLLWPTTQAKF